MGLKEKILDRKQIRSNTFRIRLDNPQMSREKGLLVTDFHLPYNPQLVERARKLRTHMTPAEKKLWYTYLKTFKFRVLRQRPIDNFIVDFYCAELKLVIEIDGNSHFTKVGKEYDAARTEILEGYGLKVMRFSNDEMLNNLESLCQRLEELLPPTPL